MRECLLLFISSAPHTHLQPISRPTAFSHTFPALEKTRVALFELYKPGTPEYAELFEESGLMFGQRKKKIQWVLGPNENTHKNTGCCDVVGGSML